MNFVQEESEVIQMKRYDPYTDTIISDDVPETMFQIQVVELTETCIERIANAIVKKIKDGDS